MRDWTTINVKYFALPITALVFGMVIGVGLSESKKKPTKQYPIEILCHWETNGLQGNAVMEVDSVKGDIIYKNGITIVSKNIINIKFK